MSVFAIGILLFSCSDPDVTGVAVQPPGNSLNVMHTDTNSLVTRTLRESSIKSVLTRMYCLGSYTDAIFGESKAGFYSQFLSEGIANMDSTGFQVDSVIMSLAYSDSYGDTTLLQKIKVIGLFGNDSIKMDKEFIPRPQTPYVYKVKSGSTENEIKETPQLRIRLSAAFENKIQLDSSTYKLVANLFNGMHLESMNTFVSGGAILTYDLSVSKITVHYHNNKTDSLKYDFIVNSSCERIDYFNHDYAGTPLKSNLNNPSHGDSLVYIQGLSGTKVKISIPYLNNYFNKGYIINKAELIITTENSTNGDYFNPPSKLYLTTIGENGESIPLKDGGVGTYNSTTKQYSINIPRHVQSLLNGSLKNNGLYLAVDESSFSADRAVIFGGKNVGNRIKILLTYTKI